MNTVLLVEDDKLLRCMLKKNFERENFIIYEAAVGKRSLEILKYHHVDLILLDLRLPDGSGLDFIREIRRHTDVPLIIVSSEGGRDSCLDGFDLGADDYVRKPFEIDELIARVKANLRRYNGDASNQNTKGAGGAGFEKVTFGKWVLDCDQYQIFDEENCSGDLTAKEFQLLHLLINSAGRALKRDALCEAIREDNYVPTPRAIDVKIARIRKKIHENPDNHQFIKTVRGVGYMFNKLP